MEGHTSAEVKRSVYDALVSQAMLLRKRARMHKYTGPRYAALRALWRQQARLSQDLARDISLIGDADLDKFLDDAKARARYNGLYA